MENATSKQNYNTQKNRNMKYEITYTKELTYSYVTEAEDKEDAFHIWASDPSSYRDEVLVKTKQTEARVNVHEPHKQLVVN